jgi:hypothetical protein
MGQLAYFWANLTPFSLKHGSLKMRVTMYRTIYAKMMSQDMAYFEEKFKQKDQARGIFSTSIQSPYSLSSTKDKSLFSILPRKIRPV